MERVIVNEGTKVPMQSLFEDLQNNTQLNSLRIFTELIQTFGVNVQTNLDGTIPASSTDLQVSAGPTTHLTVQPGEALTGNLSWIQVLNAPVVVDTSTLADGLHTVYFAQSYAYDTPVDILSGFALSLAGGGTRNSRAHDGYKFLFDFNPTLSGVALASFTTVGGTPSAVTDLRSTNVLMMRSSVIPSTVFTGNQSSGAGAPPSPKNFRITNVGASQNSTTIDNKILGGVGAGLAGANNIEMMVDIAWNWDNVSWQFYGNQLIVTFPPGGQTSFATNELVNYHLWHPYGYDYLITGNSTFGGNASLLSVTPFAPNTTQITALPPVNGGGVIHSNAQSYDIFMYPSDQSGTTYVDSERYEDHVASPIRGLAGSPTSGPVPVILKTKLYPYFGEKEFIQIRANGPLGQASAFVLLPAGSFTSSIFQSPVTYAQPFLVEMPFVSDQNVSVTVVINNTGFDLNLNVAGTGWENADTFEIIYAPFRTASASLNYGDPAVTSVFSSKTSIPVQVNVGGANNQGAVPYNIAVRPLIGGGAVSNGKNLGAFILGALSPALVQHSTIIAPGSVAFSCETFSGSLLQSTGTGQGPIAISNNVLTSTSVSQFNAPGRYITPQTYSYWFGISGFQTPAFGGANSIPPSVQKLLGKEILTYNGLSFGSQYFVSQANDFIPQMNTSNPGIYQAIQLQYGSSFAQGTAAGTFGTPVITAQPFSDFVVSWDKASRLIIMWPNPDLADFIITSVSYAYDHLTGYDRSNPPITSPIIRVYNGSDGGEFFAGTFILDPGPVGGGTASMNVLCGTKVTAAQGPTGIGGHTVIVDMYQPADDFGPANAVGIAWGPSGYLKLNWVYA